MTDEELGALSERWRVRLVEVEAERDSLSARLVEVEADRDRLKIAFSTARDMRDVTLEKLAELDDEQASRGEIVEACPQMSVGETYATFECPICRQCHDEPAYYQRVIGPATS